MEFLLLLFGNGTSREAVRCELRRGGGAFGSGTNGVPDAADAADDVRKDGVGAAEECAGSESYRERLADVGLGVELGVEDGEAGVGVVELAEGVGGEAVTLAAA